MNFSQHGDTRHAPHQTTDAENRWHSRHHDRLGSSCDLPAKHTEQIIRRPQSGRAFLLGGATCDLGSGQRSGHVVGWVFTGTGGIDLRDRNDRGIAGLCAVSLGFDKRRARVYFLHSSHCLHQDRKTEKTKPMIYPA